MYWVRKAEWSMEMVVKHSKKSKGSQKQRKHSTYWHLSHNDTTVMLTSTFIEIIKQQTLLWVTGHHTETILWFSVISFCNTKGFKTSKCEYNWLSLIILMRKPYPISPRMMLLLSSFFKTQPIWQEVLRH